MCVSKIIFFQLPMDAIRASISAWLSILPESAGDGAAAGAAAPPAAGTLEGEKPPPPPAWEDFDIILAKRACCSGLSPLESICKTSLICPT